MNNQLLQHPHFIIIFISPIYIFISTPLSGNEFLEDKFGNRDLGERMFSLGIFQIQSDIS